MSAFESVSVGGRLPGRLALTSPAPKQGPRPPGLFLFLFFSSSLLPFRERVPGPSGSPSSHICARDKLNAKKQLQTVDRSAPASMKNAANCVNQCELQDTLIIDVSNAHGGPGSLPGPRPVEGRFLPKRKFADTSASRTVPRRELCRCEAVLESE